MNLLGGEIDNNPSTGVLDSVVISYDDLRIVNSKLIELEYEKEINANLRSVVCNDSIILDAYSVNNKIIVEEKQKVTKQRNICFIVAAITTLISLIAIIK